ncbi:hypothetical protein AO240_11760 [Pseudomonas sp. ICMP 460]|nr:hypothetical protein AO240_11760 [Pseudomonas sp. ICMP 460]
MGECAMKSLWFIVIFIFLNGCNDRESTVTVHNANVELALHVSAQETIANSAEKFSKECMKNLGLCWYKIRRSANEKDLPSVTIQSADGKISFQHAIGVTVVVDDKIGKNIENIGVTLRALPDNSTHEENRNFIINLLKDIKVAGWQRFYLPEEPRISGSQAAKIDVPGEVLGHPVLNHPWLDPDYKIDIDHWLKSGPLYKWYFYHNDEYLSLMAWRRDSNDNPGKTGTYLITLGLRSEREFWLAGIVDKQDRANWKALLPKRIEEYHALRSALEKKARAAGIEIDETYQDPPINALRK